MARNVSNVEDNSALVMRRADLLYDAPAQHLVVSLPPRVARDARRDRRGVLSRI